MANGTRVGELDEMSANDCPEPAFRIVPERRVEFRRRQIEHGVIRFLHARDDERIYDSLGV